MFESFIVFIFVTIFFVLFFLVGYDFLMRYLDAKYQTLYGNYDPRYSRNLRPGCLPGCNSRGECPNGNFCYNATGPNPTCCAYDFQCKTCASRNIVHPPRPVPSLPDRLPSQTGVLPDRLPSQTGILPDRLPSQTGILPDRLPSQTGILPDRLPSQTGVLPDRLAPSLADRVRETLRPFSERLQQSLKPISEQMPKMTEDHVSGKDRPKVVHGGHNVPLGHPF